METMTDTQTAYLLRSKTYAPHRDGVVGIFATREQAEAYMHEAVPPVDDGDIEEWGISGTVRDAEAQALATLLGLLDSSNESIAFDAARTIYIDRPHAVAAGAERDISE